ncbi:MAG TPA: hypothetical protein VFQ39_00020, partial [Longimicrobium sp.]|nr:hypothetical protein [Longimicrobium sp.]
TPEAPAAQAAAGSTGEAAWEDPGAPSRAENEVGASGFTWDDPGTTETEAEIGADSGLSWDRPADNAFYAATEAPLVGSTRNVEAEAEPEPSVEGVFGEAVASEPVPAAAPEEEPAEFEHPAPATGVATPAAAAVSGAFGEVAERLESIAGALRSDPNGFLHGGAREPLELLVAGFVLGYLARGESGPGNS